MRTVLTDLSRCGLEQFTFAGMTFPKHLWTLPRGPMRERLRQRKPVAVGAYYHAPKPLTGPGSHGKGFYLASDGAPGLRWQWADEVDGSGIRHTGWHTDREGFGETIRGVVFRLPHGRGFLAGWSMGEHMASEVEYAVFDDAAGCARHADECARVAAEAERDYQDSQRDQDEAE